MSVLKEIRCGLCRLFKNWSLGAAWEATLHQPRDAPLVRAHSAESIADPANQVDRAISTPPLRASHSGGNSGVARPPPPSHMRRLPGDRI